jgi:hypothetical protein
LATAGLSLRHKPRGAGYHLPDPTAKSSQGSTSLTLSNADGIPAGYALYDGYGGVLTSTLPATLTAQGVITDPDTGLVYLGEGRW